jgi:hypothetical protein
MAISFDILSLQPYPAPVAPVPPRAPAIQAAGQRQDAQNERRQTAQDGRERANVSFRTLLNAATLSGIGRAFQGAVRETEEQATNLTQRAAKLPADAPETLSGTEADTLYRIAKAVAPKADTSVSDARAAEFRAATSRYAKSFFSVSGTFARAGESLELTA